MVNNDHIIQINVSNIFDYITHKKFKYINKFKYIPYKLLSDLINFYRCIYNCKQNYLILGTNFGIELLIINKNNNINKYYNRSNIKNIIIFNNKIHI